MQFDEGPLNRPPATFSPYEGEKGLERSRWLVASALSSGKAWWKKMPEIVPLGLDLHRGASQAVIRLLQVDGFRPE